LLKLYEKTVGGRGFCKLGSDKFLQEKKVSVATAAFVFLWPAQVIVVVS
jgi:hypothetical protein